MDQEPNNENIPYTDDSMQYDYNEVKTGGDVILDKPLINTFFDPEQIITNIEKTYKGFVKENGQWVHKNEPIARSTFINKTSNMLRSVMNPQNYNSKLTQKQIDNIMLEKNIEYIDICRVEPKWSLADEDVEMVINIFDHALQTFFGIVENGRITDVITQIATGNYDREAFRKLNGDNTKNNMFSRIFNK